MSYEPKEKQWWINGFNPQYQNVQARDLKATTKIYFSDSEEDRSMWNALINDKGAAKKWKFDEENRIAMLTW